MPPTPTLLPPPQNLPETIRESDVAKLSFAVDLASGFYDQWQGAGGGPLAPGRMLWVIQRCGAARRAAAGMY